MGEAFLVKDVMTWVQTNMPRNFSKSIKSKVTGPSEPPGTKTYLTLFDFGFVPDRVKVEILDIPSLYHNGKMEPDEQYWTTKELVNNNDTDQCYVRGGQGSYDRYVDAGFVWKNNIIQIYVYQNSRDAWGGNIWYEVSCAVTATKG